eukprot:4640556-Ditylum_brightwellii.AAC.1
MECVFRAPSSVFQLGSFEKVSSIFTSFLLYPPSQWRHQASLTLHNGCHHTQQQRPTYNSIFSTRASTVDQRFKKGHLQNRWSMTHWPFHTRKWTLDIQVFYIQVNDCPH